MFSSNILLACVGRLQGDGAFQARPDKGGSAAAAPDAAHDGAVGTGSWLGSLNVQRCPSCRFVLRQCVRGASNVYVKLKFVLRANSVLFHVLELCEMMAMR